MSKMDAITSLPSNWLDDRNAAADPWVLKTNNPNDPKWRDACLGNGYLGQRVDTEGTCDSYLDLSRSFLAGLYGNPSENPARPEGIVELPKWATLDVQVGSVEEARNLGVRKAYEQSLDLRTGVLSTSYKRVGRLSVFKIEREFFLCRHQPELAVMTVRATRLDEMPEELSNMADDTQIDTGKTGKSIAIREALDGSMVFNAEELLTTYSEEDLTLSLTTKWGRRLAIRSRLIAPKPNRYIRGGAVGSVASKIYHHYLEMGETLEVTKLVAVVSDERADDPLAYSKKLLDDVTDLASLREANDAAWAALWQTRIEVDHPRLQQLINASLFQMYVTLRHDVDWSHGPCGLGANGWDGCVFWDTDTWTLPVYAVLRPELARSCVAYRYKTLAGAQGNAVDKDQAGARWAWMSTSTGKECCSEPVFQDERHIVSCVSLGQWIYAKMAGDEAWLENEGYIVITESAKFWASLAEKNDDGSWSINQVCGADEHAGRVDDNYTTNVGAAWTLRMAVRLMNAKGETAPALWNEIADGLRLLWNDEYNVPQQMAQWEHGQTIKQADTVLSVHPWNARFTNDQMARMVDYYREHYPPAAIMMGQSIDGLIDARLGRTAGLDKSLIGLLEHFGGPYHIASESPINERAPFITGYGGFLQMLIFGALGLKIEEDHLSVNPCLPTGVHEMKLVGASYHGLNYDIQINQGEVEFIGPAAVYLKKREGA